MAIDERFIPHVKIFPATEWLPYGEPVSPAETHEGRVYFALQYLDEGLLAPHLEPVIFLGIDLDGESRNGRYFQDFDSYRAGVRYGEHSDRELARFEVYGPEPGKHIFDYEHALRLLMRCALARRDTTDIDKRILRSAKKSGESGFSGVVSLTSRLR